MSVNQWRNRGGVDSPKGGSLKDFAKKISKWWMEPHAVMIIGPPLESIGVLHSPAIVDLPTLNVGCGLRPEPDCVNADLYFHKGVNVTFDCQEFWPFPPNHFKGILASHLIEHLAKPQRFFDEAWRVLHPDGCLLVRVPHSGSTKNVWGDFSHIRPIPVESFYGLGPDPLKWTFNLQHAIRMGAWETKIIYQVLEKPWMKILPKRLVYWMVEYLNNICCETVVWLRPIKKITELDKAKMLELVGSIPESAGIPQSENLREYLTYKRRN